MACDNKVQKCLVCDAMIMRYKAVVLDLFETLITEWGHKKYTKREMCADLGVDKAAFDPFWEEKEEERYIGKQAKWYTDQFPVKRESMEGFSIALRPMDVT